MYLLLRTFTVPTPLCSYQYPAGICITEYGVRIMLAATLLDLRLLDGTLYSVLRS
ncbi:predicted protein [Histoplasma mississippiense (nom. inval.)]|uniref:predicted protein n=1 Tax=Ajellomyces capsulatus (strain NAm1 / WU24) TaxID=2059318 RepID=UPI000157D026|nr:predicted protein [Histoplasma mississippiense (nom. inval.)]EDN11223.1 predicted protein [Histoplasma mississippiense (nom. inval.)]